MNQKIQGSCLCGDVLFELANRFERLVLCHCDQCRKITGSAHASNLIGDLASLRFLQGADAVALYRHPTRDFSKAFCKLCGSGLPYVNATGTAVIVPAGSLNSEPNVVQGDNIFTEERPEWSLKDSQYKLHVGFGDLL